MKFIEYPCYFMNNFILNLITYLLPKSFFVMKKKEEINEILNRIKVWWSLFCSSYYCGNFKPISGHFFENWDQSRLLKEFLQVLCDLIWNAKFQCCLISRSCSNSFRSENPKYWLRNTWMVPQYVLFNVLVRLLLLVCQEAGGSKILQ